MQDFEFEFIWVVKGVGGSDPDPQSIILKLVFSSLINFHITLVQPHFLMGHLNFDIQTAI